ncbi:hypothetical protein [Taibaiella koreensis]|uniref:hypothetical protein n=1 Tax=Taibaiella koreensis TaxID=1268548 RepID=UPI000E59C8C2|nr:hypothetical protein [Taibaiella koreensis]
MSLYRLFVIAFVLSALSFGVFVYYYIHLVTDMLQAVHKVAPGQLPESMLRDMFSPGIFIAATVLGLSGMLYRVLGIVFIARNPLLEGGEKVMWILGFVLMGFITAMYSWLWLRAVRLPLQKTGRRRRLRRINFRKRLLSQARP